MYNPNAQHGYADQKSFMEVHHTSVSAIQADEEPTNVSGINELRRFAHLVYQVNPSVLELSGDIMVDVDTDNLETINANGFSDLTGQIENLQLINANGFNELSGQTSNLQAINADGFSDLTGQINNLQVINADGFNELSGQLVTLNNNVVSGGGEPQLTISVEASGNFTWIAEALPGTTLATSAWRVKQIEDVTINGYQTIRTLWADGNSDFDNVATSPLSALSYS